MPPCQRTTGGLLYWYLCCPPSRSDSWFSEIILRCRNLLSICICLNTWPIIYCGPICFRRSFPRTEFETQKRNSVLSFHLKFPENKNNSNLGLSLQICSKLQSNGRNERAPNVGQMNQTQPPLKTISIRAYLLKNSTIMTEQLALPL